MARVGGAVGKIRVLFVCIDNAVRSQMAEAFLRAQGGGRFEARSAGLRPREIDPMATTVMAERGFDLRGHRAKSLAQVCEKPGFDYVITLCNRAERRRPGGSAIHLSWPFEDPAAFQGSTEERLSKYREVRDRIDHFVCEWLVQLPPQRSGPRPRRTRSGAARG